MLHIVFHRGSAMNSAWQVKAGFWGAITASCLWLALVTTVDVSVILRTYADGFGGDRTNILLRCIFLIQPPLILWLIIRAIRLRNSGQPVRVLARALLPLGLALATFACVLLARHLFDRAALEQFHRWETGEVTYLCSQSTVTADYDPRTAGPIGLRLIEVRQPNTLGTWTVSWPGQKPIKAKAFPARTGSIGGSMGLRWTEADSQHKVAYLSFSDIVGPTGTTSIWLEMRQDIGPKGAFDPDILPPTRFTCGPDPKSYRP